MVQCLKSAGDSATSGSVAQTEQTPSVVDLGRGRSIGGRWSDLSAPPLPDRPITYVARAKGSRLVPGSRLSDYFEGPDGRRAAYDLRDTLRTSVPDAAVFEAESRESAEQLLSPEGQSHG